MNLPIVMADTPNQSFFVSLLQVYQWPPNPDHPAGDLQTISTPAAMQPPTSVIGSPEDSLSVVERSMASFQPTSVTPGLGELADPNTPPAFGLKVIRMCEVTSCSDGGGGGDCEQQRPESGIVWP